MTKDVSYLQLMMYTDSWFRVFVQIRDSECLYKLRDLECLKDKCGILEAGA